MLLVLLLILLLLFAAGGIWVHPLIFILVALVIVALFYGGTGNRGWYGRRSPP